MPFAFYGFELDVEQGRLLRDGQEVPLERRVFELLCYFAQNPERLITKDELMRDVWRAQSLSNGVMGNAVAKLRRALGQAPNADLPIETVHGRGYRFQSARSSERRDSRATPAPALRDVWQRGDPFCGRERVIEALSNLLELARTGRGTATVLAGSAGIGKTRTARELASRARSLGFRTYFGAAYEGETRAPYWPFTQMLRQAREEHAAEGFAAHLPAAAGVLALVMPELQTPAALQPVLEPSAVRFQLFDEVTRVFASLSIEHPLLLVFDDIHWADRAAIELFNFAVRALEDRPVALLANLRDDELSPTDARRAALGALDRIAKRVTLPGLTVEEVGLLSDSLGGPGAESDALRELHARTGGNPFFVRQLLETAEDTRAGELPAAVRGVLRAKLTRLDSSARDSASAAAVIGPEFTLSALAAVLERPPEAVLEDLEALSFAGFIEQRGGTELFTFAHDLLREALRAELSVGARGALHLRIARWLASQPDRERTDRLSEVAHHQLNALPSQLTEAVTACRRAAAAAHESAGFEASARLLSLAIDKLDAEHGDPNLRCELAIELGTSLFHALDIDRAWLAYRSAADGAEKLERFDLLAQLVPHLVNCVELVAGDAAFVRRMIELALARVPATLFAQRASLLAHQVELANELSSSARAALLDEADKLAAQSGEIAAILEVAHSRSNLRDPTTLAENHAAAERLLGLIEQHRAAADTLRYRLIRRLSAWITHYVAAITGCDLAAADRAFAAVEALARSSGVRPIALTASFMRAGRALAADQLDELEQIIQVGFSAQLEFASRAGLVFGRYALALAQARGNLALLAGIDLEAVQIPNVTRRHATDAAIARAHLYALIGRPQRAASALEGVSRDELARMPVLFGDLGLLCQLAETVCLIEHTELAEVVYERLQPYAARNALLPHFEYWGAVAHFLAMLASTRGHADAARRYFEQAREINRALGMPRRVAATESALAAL